MYAAASRAASRAAAASNKVARSSTCRSSASAYPRSRSIRSSIAHLLVVVAQGGVYLVQIGLDPRNVAAILMARELVPLFTQRRGDVIPRLPQRLRQPLGSGFGSSLRNLCHQNSSGSTSCVVLLLTHLRPQRLNLGVLCGGGVGYVGAGVVHKGLRNVRVVNRLHA